jgi:hypothetical protein
MSVSKKREGKKQALLSAFLHSECDVCSLNVNNQLVEH